jgi:5'-AMP-activated protein kinase, regulatory gamma subunit
MVNNQNQFEDIITQSDIVSFIVQHKDSLDQRLVSKTVEELGIVTKRVVSITEKDEALAGFRLMVERKVGAIAVVEAGTEKLVGQLAAGVLRGIDETNYADLRLPVKEFLKKHSVIGYNTCKLSTVLSDLLANLHKFRIHRVFVIDDNGRCIGVITLSDIIACLYRESNKS